MTSKPLPRSETARQDRDDLVIEQRRRPTLDPPENRTRVPAADELAEINAPRPDGVRRESLVVLDVVARCVVCTLVIRGFDAAETARRARQHTHETSHVTVAAAENVLLTYVPTWAD